MATSFLQLGKQKSRPNVALRDWMKDKTLELVTEETLASVVDRCIEAGLYALDLETTGLDVRVFDGRTKDQIVGACLSPDGIHGYYIPVRHKGEGAKHNLPLSLFESELRRLVGSPARTIFHNGKYDQELLQFNGGEPIGEWDEPKGWEDSLILAYLNNSKLERVGLKYLADSLLNPDYERDLARRREGQTFPSYMIELKELYPSDHDESQGYDFSELDPGWPPVVWYAAGDAICTYQLYVLLHPKVTKPEEGLSQRTIYNIEKMCCAATRWMERCRVHVNQDRVATLIQLGQKELFESVKAIYDFCEETCGRSIAPAWWHVLEHGVKYEGDKEDIPPLFDPDNVEQDYRAQIEEAKKIVAHNNKRPTWDRSESLAQISEQEGRRAEKVLSTGETKEFPVTYDVMSSQQLGPLFEEMEVPDLRRTEKTKQVMTTGAEMDRLTEKYGDTFPFMARIKRFREVQKALSSYLLPLRHDAHTDGTLKIDYNAWRVDTGRFATPADRNPKRNGGTSYPMHGTPATYDPDRPECLRRIRECITARPGRILAACFAEGTLVSTGRGLVPVEQVGEDDLVLLESGLQPVTWSGCTGTKDTVRIVTSKGFSLQVTPDHRIMTVGSHGLKWKEARDFKCGDWVVQAEGWAQKAQPRLPPVPYSEEEKAFRVPRKVCKEFAEFLGRFMGDGSISHRDGAPVNVNFALGDDLDFLLSELNLFASRHFEPLQWSPRGEKGDVTVASRPLARWMLEVTGKTKTSTARVPVCIMQGTQDNVCAFLRGLFDAEGSAGGRKGDGVSIWITSSSMSQEVQLLLLGVGVQAKRVYSSRVTNLGPQSGWLLTITGIRNLERFRARVGFVTPRKILDLDFLVGQRRSRDATEFFPLGLAKKAVVGRHSPEAERVYKNGKRKGRVSRKALELARNCVEDIDEYWMEWLVDGPLMFDTVTEVVSSGPTKVYDISVQDAARLQTNGIMAHNCDYAGEELRIITNMSREPKWITEFFRCSSCDKTFERGDGQKTPEAPPPFCPRCGSDKIGDIHTLSALAFYGEGAQDDAKKFKLLRKNAKNANFALCYGGSGKAVQRQVKCDENEGWRIYRQFTGTYDILQKWWEGQHEFVKEHGYVITAFGRRCPLPDINLPRRDPVTKRDNGLFISKAKRNALNSPVQGTGADFLKLAMALIYKECKKRGWLEKVYMIACMHDELVFEITTDILEEALGMVMPLMVRNSAILKLRWPVPFTLDCELGYDWTVPWNLSEFTCGIKEWPEELKSFFPRATASPQEQEPESEAPAQEQPSAVPTQAQEQAPAVALFSDQKKPAEEPALKGGEVYVHRLRKPLRQGTVEALAQILHECKNRGSHPIEVRSQDGESVLWKSTDFTINPVQFSVLADREGI